MILDVCVGSAGFYHNRHLKLEEEFVGIDVRKGDFTYKTHASRTQTRVIVRPTILADMKYLPFRDALFHIIVFDPPHTSAGLKSWMAQHYGSWTQHETIKTLRKANMEFARVLRPHGSLILKIIPRGLPLYEALLRNFCFFYPSTPIDYVDPIKNRRAALTLQHGLLHSSNLNSSVLEKEI